MVVTVQRHSDCLQRMVVTVQRHLDCFEAVGDIDPRQSECLQAVGDIDPRQSECLETVSDIAWGQLNCPSAVGISSRRAVRVLVCGVHHPFLTVGVLQSGHADPEKAVGLPLERS
jgi:hypothetical protein